MSVAEYRVPGQAFIGPAMSVRDDRLPPFAWLALDSLARIRELAPAAQMASVRNVYTAIAEAASRARDPQQAHLKTTRAEIAHLAGVSVKTVDRSCLILCELGLLAIDARVDDDGRTLPSVYRLTRGGDMVTPPVAITADTESPPNARTGYDGKKEELPTADRAQAPLTHGRQRVPAHVAEQAQLAVAEWSSRTGQHLRALDGRGKPTDSLKRVMGAMLSFPEIAECWQAMIDAALLAPWWTDDAPGVGVVFGPRVVERMIEQAKRPPANVHPIAAAGARPTRFQQAQASLAALHSQLTGDAA